MSGVKVSYGDAQAVMRSLANLSESNSILHVVTGSSDAIREVTLEPKAFDYVFHTLFSASFLEFERVRYSGEFDYRGIKFKKGL